jgi:DNA-binding HxlR family transcriptional regulator
MGEYGQFCPVAKAVEVLDERWTLLVVRELVAGSQRFNEIHRGVPRMSRTLLSKRLQTLVQAGVVARSDGAHGPTYQLTETGRELESIVDALGRWGVRWMSALGDEDCDPALLVWDMHRRIDLAALPEAWACRWRCAVAATTSPGSGPVTTAWSSTCHRCSRHAWTPSASGR